MIMLMDYVWTTLMALLGLVFGSFAGAQIWRLRARQLVADKKEGEAYDAAEYKRLKPLYGRKQKSDRSQCLACGHTLGWKDLVPVISWITLGGKCRYCHKPIGKFELVMEFSMALLFVASYLLWPYGFSVAGASILFGLWLLAIVLLVMLAAYDYKWQLLPDVLNYAFAGVSLAFMLVRLAAFPGSVSPLSALGAVGILAGVYALLYVVSKGKWIGFGDVKLGVGLGLLLADWKLAFLALFLANLIGCLIVIPGMLTKKLNPQSRIAFGPLLIIGTLIAYWWGTAFTTWLFNTTWFIS